MGTKQTEYIQVRMVDKKRISEAMATFKGKRTMAQYAEDCGGSAPSFSRIYNGNYSKPLSIELLRTLYEHREEDIPGGFDALVGANGMESREEYIRKKTDDGELHERARKLRDAKYSLMTVIENSLFTRGNNVQIFQMPNGLEEIQASGTYENNGLYLKYDYCLLLNQSEGTPQWFFVIFPGSPTGRLFAEDSDHPSEDEIRSSGKYNIVKWINGYAQNFLLDAWHPEKLNDIKISYVFSNAIHYKEFREYLKKVDLNGEVTTILVDENSFEVAKEEWLNCPQAAGAKSRFEAPIKRRFSMADYDGEEDE